MNGAPSALDLRLTCARPQAAMASQPCKCLLQLRSRRFVIDLRGQRSIVYTDGCTLQADIQAICSRFGTPADQRSEFEVGPA